MDITTIVASALIVDTTTAGILQASGMGGKKVREWYRTLRVGAYAMDVLSLVIGAYVAMRAVPHSLGKQLALVVAIQMTHDVLFGMFVQSRHAKGPLMTLFKQYASEMGAHILWADAAMMIATVLVARQLMNVSKNNNDTAFLGVVAAYVGLLVVYSF